MTALDIIKRSMRLLGVYAIGEAPSSDEANDCLTALNQMLDSWANENLFVYAKTLDVVPLVANTASYTVGPSGGVITPRPVEVLASSYIDYQSVSYQLMIATLSDYNSIPIKTQALGIPFELYVLPNVPNVTLNLWPVPSAAMTLNLWSNKQIQSFATVTDTITLPPGYERALAYSLAEEMGPEFDAVVSPDIKAKALQARKVLKRTNTEVPRLRIPAGIPMGGMGTVRRYPTTSSLD
jgi:hypothetical protein